MADGKEAHPRHGTGGKGAEDTWAVSHGRSKKRREKRSRKADVLVQQPSQRLEEKLQRLGLRAGINAVGNCAQVGGGNGHGKVRAGHEGGKGGRGTKHVISSSCAAHAHLCLARDRTTARCWARPARQRQRRAGRPAPAACHHHGDAPRRRGGSLPAVLKQRRRGTARRRGSLRPAARCRRRRAPSARRGGRSTAQAGALQPGATAACPAAPEQRRAREGLGLGLGLGVRAWRGWKRGLGRETEAQALGRGGPSPSRGQKGGRRRRGTDNTEQGGEGLPGAARLLTEATAISVIRQ